MKMNKILLSLVAVSVIAASCSTSLTVQKKQHSNGYYVSLSTTEKKSQKVEKNVRVEKKTEVLSSNEIATSKLAEKSKVGSTSNITKRNVTQAPLKAEAKSNSAKTTVISNDAKSNGTKATTIAAVKKRTNNMKPKNADDDLSVRMLIIIILTIVIPPLGVYLYEHEARPAIIDLLLFILGLVVGAILPFGLGFGLGWILAWLYGFCYIFGVKL